MRIHTGVDLVNVTELDRLAAREGEINRVWTQAEQQAHAAYPERRAAQFASKEAVMKVLERGIGALDPLDIEIVTPEGAPPEVLLFGQGLLRAQELGITSISLSITHEMGVAIAIAVALADETGGLHD